MEPRQHRNPLARRLVPVAATTTIPKRKVGSAESLSKCLTKFYFSHLQKPKKKVVDSESEASNRTTSMIRSLSKQSKRCPLVRIFSPPTRSSVVGWCWPTEVPEDDYPGCVNPVVQACKHHLCTMAPNISISRSATKIRTTTTQRKKL